jgi:hypothetical protein
LAWVLRFRGWLVRQENILFPDPRYAVGFSRFPRRIL